MALVRSLGLGYYAIESDGVTISKGVTDLINKAFADAEAIPTENLKIRGWNERRKRRSAKRKK